ncbi:hypothetical protein ACJX0J_025460, partial [Zea mays]
RLDWVNRHYKKYTYIYINNNYILYNIKGHESKAELFTHFLIMPIFMLKDGMTEFSPNSDMLACATSGGPHALAQKQHKRNVQIEGNMLVAAAAAACAHNLGFVSHFSGEQLSLSIFYFQIFSIHIYINNNYILYNIKGHESKAELFTHFLIMPIFILFTSFLVAKTHVSCKENGPCMTIFIVWAKRFW